MYSLRPRSVLGQALLAVCLVTALLVFHPVSVRSSGESNWADPFLIGKTASASVKIDTASRLVSGLAVIPILVRNDVEFGQFLLEVDFCPENLTYVGAEAGEALSETGWEYFHYRLEVSTDALYRVQLTGVYDIPDAHQGVPLAPNSEYVSLVTLQFVVHTGEFPSGTFFPIIFEWEVDDCLENTFQDTSSDTLYASRDSTQFNVTDCPPESLECSFVSPSVEFVDGGVYAFHPQQPLRGDINLNSIPYEIADLWLFANYLLYGDSVLTTDPEAQSANSDVNWDEFRWSMADFIHLARVILYDAIEVTEPTPLSEYDMETWMTTVHSLPNDTVVLPVWYKGTGSERVQGISFKADFDPDSLSLVEVDLTETSLEDWEVTLTRLEEGSIRLNACPDFILSPTCDSLTSYNGPRQIAKLVFEVSDVDTPAFISVSFGDDTSSQVEANAFATTDGGLTRLGISDVRDGGIQVGGSLECKRGDVNYNDISYEVADWVLFWTFLLEGPGAFLYDPLYHMCATNANADSLYGTIADLLYLWRVIVHDAVEIPGKHQVGDLPEPSDDEYRLVSASAHPGDVISVPLWFTNSVSCRGITFKLTFDENLLSVEGVDTSESRMPGWEFIGSVIDRGELFLFAHANWWDLGLNDPLIGSGDGLLLRASFSVDESAPAGAFLPITFEIKEDWGHYNSYTDSTGLILIQPPTVSGWIFTDVISGDSNSDGVVDIADAVYLLNYLFRHYMPPSPLSLGDFNEDGEVNIADVVALLNYLFRG